MGGGNLSEDALGLAKRELVEETRITTACWERLSKVHLSNWVSDEVG